MKTLNNTNFTSSLKERIRFNERLTFAGIFLGFMLMVISIIVDLLYHNRPVNVDNIDQVFRGNPIHWIVSTAPLFLGIIFYVMGKLINDREKQLEHRAKEDKEQYRLLENFIVSLEQGKLDSTIPEQFNNKEMAGQLERFKNKLKIERIEEEKRLWENKGMASFGDILRSGKDIDQLSLDVIRFLIRYLECNQGSVFLLNEANPEELVLDLTACYAFDKKKFINKTIRVGQGLVGQCFLEKETMVLYQVPNDYIKITSGLGTANPNCVVIVPMRSNDDVCGVIEIASFKKLEKHEIKFLEKCAEAYASIVKSGRINENVKTLLQSSQQQTEELRSQEEEMRQNMEELQTIQEQLTRQLDENLKVKKNLEAREKVLSLTTILSEADLYGTITYVNSKFCEVSQYSADELIGQGHNFVRHPDMPREIFRLMWSTIKKGETFRGIVKNRKKDGSPYWVDATIVPIIEEGRIVKYIGARYHIQDEKTAEKLFAEQLERLDIIPNRMDQKISGWSEAKILN